MAETGSLPRHIAFIMDGNGRWATQRGLPRLEGHRAGIKAIRAIIKFLGEHKIGYVTLYAFSSENWNRPKEEIDGLFRILGESIKKEAIELNKNNVRIRHLGRVDGLPPNLSRDIDEVVRLTTENNGMTLSLAFNYGGRQEIVDAVRRIVADGISSRDIDEKLVADYLYTAGLPDVDLLVRTGDELRISNFLLWQSAYAEFYFTRVLWPDFDHQEMDKALRSYSQRERRFGGL